MNQTQIPLPSASPLILTPLRSRIPSTVTVLNDTSLIPSPHTALHAFATRRGQHLAKARLFGLAEMTSLKRQYNFVYSCLVHQNY